MIVVIVAMNCVSAPSSPSSSAPPTRPRRRHRPTILPLPSRARRYWLAWMKREIGPDATAIVNLRDLPKAMLQHADRVVDAVAGLARLPPDSRPAALLFEEPFGEYLPCEVAGWAALLRQTMDQGGWTSRFQEDGKSLDGALLVHIHRQWWVAGRGGGGA